jgi:hypothetical protein
LKCFFCVCVRVALQAEAERLMREAARTPRVGGSVIATPGFTRASATPLASSWGGGSSAARQNAKTPRRVGL